MHILCIYGKLAVRQQNVVHGMQMRVEKLAVRFRNLAVRQQKLLCALESWPYASKRCPRHANAC